MKPFRFGVAMFGAGSRTDWIGKCRKAEDLGYDVVGVADHLGMPAPFPALVLAAENTDRVRLNTFVLNAGFHNPALLARDVTTTDLFTDGRLEVGIGTGYLEADFAGAGLPWPTPGQRVEHYQRTITELKRAFDDPDHKPRPAQQPGPPLLLCGRGKRVLGLAAEHADIIGFVGTADTKHLQMYTSAELQERTDYVTAALGERAPGVELNFLTLFVLVTDDRRAALEGLQQKMLPNQSVEELGDLPGVLAGTAAQIAEQVVAHRERFGFSYFTVMEHNLETFAPVVELLRGK